MRRRRLKALISEETYLRQKRRRDLTLPQKLETVRTLAQSALEVLGQDEPTPDKIGRLLQIIDMMAGEVTLLRPAVDELSHLRHNIAVWADTFDVRGDV